MQVAEALQPLAGAVVQGGCFRRHSLTAALVQPANGLIPQFGRQFGPSLAEILALPRVGLQVVEFKGLGLRVPDGLPPVATDQHVQVTGPLLQGFVETKLVVTQAEDRSVHLASTRP